MLSFWSNTASKTKYVLHLCDDHMRFLVEFTKHILLEFGFNFTNVSGGIYPGAYCMCAIYTIVIWCYINSVTSGEGNLCRMII